MKITYFFIFVIGAVILMLINQREIMNGKK